MWTYYYVHSADVHLLKRLDRALAIAAKVEEDLNTIAHNFSVLVEFMTKPPPVDPVVGIVAEQTDPVSKGQSK